MSEVGWHQPEVGDKIRTTSVIAATFRRSFSNSRSCSSIGFDPVGNSSPPRVLLRLITGVSSFVVVSRRECRVIRFNGVEFASGAPVTLCESDASDVSVVQRDRSASGQAARTAARSCPSEKTRNEKTQKETIKGVDGRSESRGRRPVRVELFNVVLLYPPNIGVVGPSSLCCSFRGEAAGWEADD